MLAVAALSVNPAIGFNGQSVGDWISGNLVFVGIMVVVLVIIVAAITKRPRDAVISFAICLLAILLISMASHAQEIGTWLQNTFFGG